MVELHIENLIPTNRRTKEEVRANSRKGGIKSGIVRKEKKLLSQMYADFLIEEHNIKIDNKEQKLSGMALVRLVTSKVLTKGDNSSVSMLKEIREATEGSKIAHSGEMDNQVTIKFE